MTYDHATIEARSALLDAAEALDEHIGSMVLVGAQAIYLYTGDSDVPVATHTKDCDLGIILGQLRDRPLIEATLKAKGFQLTTARDGSTMQGRWLGRAGAIVDLLAPEGVQDHGDGRVPRGARIPPHANTAVRNVSGIEGIELDHREMTVVALDPADGRSARLKVAGPATLFVAKIHKICERLVDVEGGLRDRTADKDAHDLYRLLRSLPASETQEGLQVLLGGEATRKTAKWATNAAREFGTGADSAICETAGRYEELVGDPDLVAASMATLLREIIDPVPGS